MNLQFVRTTDIQRNFKSVLTKLRSTKEPVIVLRDSIPEAVMLSYAEYKRISEIDKQLLIANFEKIWKEIGERNSSVPDEEIDKAIRQAKRYAKRRR